MAQAQLNHLLSEPPIDFSTSVCVWRADTEVILADGKTVTAAKPTVCPLSVWWDSRENSENSAPLWQRKDGEDDIQRNKGDRWPPSDIGEKWLILYYGCPICEGGGQGGDASFTTRDTSGDASSNSALQRLFGTEGFAHTHVQFDMCIKKDAVWYLCIFKSPILKTLDENFFSLPLRQTDRWLSWSSGKIHCSWTNCDEICYK